MHIKLVKLKHQQNVVIRKRSFAGRRGVLEERWRKREEEVKEGRQRERVG